MNKEEGVKIDYSVLKFQKPGERGNKREQPYWMTSVVNGKEVKIARASFLTTEQVQSEYYDEELGIK